jgi:hypothetical protein
MKSTVLWVMTSCSQVVYQLCGWTHCHHVWCQWVSSESRWQQKFRQLLWRLGATGVSETSMSFNRIYYIIPEDSTSRSLQRENIIPQLEFLLLFWSVELGNRLQATCGRMDHRLINSILQLPSYLCRMLLEDGRIQLTWKNLGGRYSGLFQSAVWADCLDNVGSLTSHNPIGLHGLLTGIALLFFFTLLPELA